MWTLDNLKIISSVRSKKKYIGKRKTHFCLEHGDSPLFLEPNVRSWVPLWNSKLQVFNQKIEKMQCFRITIAKYTSSLITNPSEASQSTLAKKSKKMSFLHLFVLIVFSAGWRRACIGNKTLPALPCGVTTNYNCWHSNGEGGLFSYQGSSDCSPP